MLDSNTHKLDSTHFPATLTYFGESGSGQIHPIA